MNKHATPSGRFRWLERMGIHEAYHADQRNRLLHWLCIPLELFGATLILSRMAFPLLGQELDMAMLAVAFLAPIYIATEVLAGTFMTVLLALLWILAKQLPLTFAGALVWGTFFLVVGFAIQTRIGHRVYEKQGRDDTDRNIKELLTTKNPIPILLIFYYHLVEILFALGYRPKLKDRVDFFKNREMAKFRQDSIA